MKRTYLVFLVILSSLSLAACGGYTPDNNWVLEKSRLTEVPEIEEYVMNLQTSPDKKGFKVFTISEGRKMVVISTGNIEKSLELEDVKVDSGNTKVVLKEIENKNNEENPYLMVGLSAIKGKLFVMSVDGNSYDEL